MACFGDGFKPLKETEESVKPQLELAGRSARQGVIKAAPISWPAGPQLADRAAIKARRRRNLSELPAGVLASPSALAGEIIVEAPALDVESGASSHWPQAKPARSSTGARLSDQPLPAVAEEQEGAAADEVDACDDALSMASVCISLGRSLAAEVVYSADLMPEEDSMLFADEALACFSLTHTEEDSELEEGEIPAAAAATTFVADNICEATAFTAPEPALNLGSTPSPVSITPAAIDDAALTTIIASDAEHPTLEAAEAAAPASVPDSQATIDEATLQAIFDDLERSLVEDARSPPPPAAPMPLGAEDSLASSTTDISEAALQAIFDDLERSLLEDALSPQPPAAPMPLGAEDSLASSTTDISEAALQAIFDDLERSLTESAAATEQPEEVSDEALQAIFDELDRALTESAAAAEQPEEWSDEAADALFDELDRAFPLPAAVDNDTECGPAALPASDPAADSDSDSDGDSSTASEISDEAMAAFFGKLDRSPRTYDLSPLACPADEVPACDELAAPGTPEASWSSGSDVLISLRMTLGEFEAASRRS
ncbi:hypothetical protein QBZ16_004921 [Prototheca wickerhamii]|uniref:Uncharacterized protein n=1 Tax=Prototheca wickerhamii TaxID=3111 RepID=A0AAD9IJG1_PROWI|nr:hypothetical protein QBZ16_004921 [Prototheca wickerhamii]